MFRKLKKLYSNHLNTGLIWYSNCRFVTGCKMVWYSNGGLKTTLKKACLWSKMSGIQMVRHVTWLYHLNIRHPYCPVFRCLVFRWLLYLKLSSKCLRLVVWLLSSSSSSDFSELTVLIRPSKDLRFSVNFSCSDINLKYWMGPLINDATQIRPPPSSLFSTLIFVDSRLRDIHISQFGARPV